MLDAIRAVTLGHAVADALGVPVEFCARKTLKDKPITDMIGYGTYDVPAGTWSDDTSMSLCALKSLAKGRVDYNDIMNNFCKWYYNDEFTATGELFDIGITCSQAIDNYCNYSCTTEQCGLSSITSNGNGSLMRIYPFVLYAYFNNIEGKELIDIISKASALTHAHIYSIDGCIIYTHILMELLKKQCKESVHIGLAKAVKDIKSHDVYKNLLSDNFIKSNEDNIKSSGYIVDTLEASVWCLLTTDNYKDCVLKAVNLGGDTDTIAAIAGSLVGALYGINNIPKEWLKMLKKEKYIESMCENAYNTWRENIE